MANLKIVFEKGVSVAFEIFEESVLNGKYLQESSSNDGFATAPPTETEIKTIITSFEQKDIESLSYGQEIQPTDLKCLIPGSYLTNVAPTTQDSVFIESDFYGNVLNKTYSVVAFDVDPYKVLYTILLRNA